MKLTSEEKRAFIADLRLSLEQRGWTVSELARRSGVTQGQASRIAAGEFKTFSSSVITICISLGMEAEAYCGKSRHTKNEDERHIANSALAIWNGTHQDADVIVSLLREIAKLRRPDRKR